MIVVFDIQAVPGLALQFVLPVGHGPLQLPQVKGHTDHIGHEAVGLHVGEGDHLVQHLARSLGHIAQSHVRGGLGALPHHEAVVVVQHVLLELHQVLIDRGLVDEVLHPVGHRQGRIAVGQALVLGDEGDDVLPEAVHAHVQPEAHDLLDLFPDPGIVHVQVRLLLGEQVQVVLVQALVVLPGAALEHTGPVVGRQPPPGHRPARAPGIVVVIGVVLPLSALLKPEMLVRGMVHHQVHEHLHAPGVGFAEHPAEDLQVAVVRMDVPVVGDVVAEIRVGRGIERREPDRVRTQAFDVIQLAQNAPQIPDAVSVPIAEAPGPDLIHDHLLVPLLFFHTDSPP